MKTNILNHKTATELCPGAYSAHWGLTDLYPQAETKLQELLSSGENFRIEWGCKKEIRYATVDKENTVDVTVTSYMDDLYDDNDLIYDALSDRLGIEELLPQEMLDDIYDTAIDADICSESCGHRELPYEATYEDIMKAIEELEDETEAANDAMFNRLCDIVEYYYGFISSYAKEEEEEEEED